MTQYAHLKRLLEQATQIMRDDPVMRDNWRLKTIEEFANDVRVQQEAAGILRRLGLMGIVKIGNTEAYEYESYSDTTPRKININIKLGWHQQIQARRVYGKCFPERCGRYSGAGGNSIFRQIVWSGKSNDARYTVTLTFSKKWEGEKKIDGCEITRRWIEPAPVGGQYSISSHCQMRKVR